MQTLHIHFPLHCAADHGHFGNFCASIATCNWGLQTFSARTFRVSNNTNMNMLFVAIVVMFLFIFRLFYCGWPFVTVLALCYWSRVHVGPVVTLKQQDCRS